MPNLRLGNARTAPVVLKVRLWRDAGASLPPGLRPFSAERVPRTLPKTPLTPSVRARFHALIVAIIRNSSPVRGGLKYISRLRGKGTAPIHARQTNIRP